MAGLLLMHEFYYYFVTGAAPVSAGFSGNVVVGLGVTVPLICRTTLSVLAFEETVTVLLIPPTLFVL